VTEHNPFNLDELVVEAPATTSKAKAGPKAARQRRGSFIQITATQASLLANAKRPVTFCVFFHLMFRSFWAYHKPFVLPGDALEYAGVSRFSQMRALRNLEKLGLISMERGGGRNPPTISIIGTTKRT
jgi:hypothetical protein